MDIHQELSEYLMSNLVDSYSDFDSDSLFAFATMVNISISGDSISESMLSLYTAPIASLIGREMIDACVSYFHGASLLNVVCDCTTSSEDCSLQQINDSDWTEQGRNDAANGSPMYNRANTEILALRTELF
jgi:hypothetical protein